MAVVATSAAAPWDLSALLNAADPRASRPERHLWLARLMQWLRHAPTADDASRATPRPVLRLRLLLKALDQDSAHRARVQALLQAFWRDVDLASLPASLGLAPRTSLAAAMAAGVAQRLLPATPDTTDLGALFPLLFEDADGAWLAEVDDDTLARVAALLRPDDPQVWRRGLLDAMTHLVSAVRAAAFAPAMRLRMEPSLLADDPFGQLARATDAVRDALEAADTPRTLQAASFLRALLPRCREAAASIRGHLQEYGVSVDLVFVGDQLRERTQRIEDLIDALMATGPREGLRLVRTLIAAQTRARSLRAQWLRHNRLLARQVTERSAETGEHYITRNAAEYRDMLRRAAGGGAVIAVTTFGKFAVLALGLSAFWSGFWAGANYAASFVVVMLLHWTVATKQPAMTAPALALRLAGGARSPADVEGFVDEVVHLIRSQVAGIAGNLALCAPLVWLAQVASGALAGAPLVGAASADHVLHDLTLLGPTALFAAFTGVLLFASSLIAGWAENRFVLHRLDSAIAWNPRIVALLGRPRAQRWSVWWRANISGLAGNISLGLMLGLVPAIAGFLGLGLQVRHVTLSTGQLAAALGALGPALLWQPAFWWCVAGIAVTGVLNVGVSFWLAFRTALQSQGIDVKERQAIHAALRRRMLRKPLAFLWPPATTTQQGAGAAPGSGA
jgi:site-specific recombinase